MVYRVAVAALLFGVLGAVLSAALMAEPVKKMADAARRIGEGRLDTRVEVESRNELGDLARTLNRMAAELKDLDQLKQDFVSSVTHEFRSPLSAMKAHLDLFFRGRLGTLTDEQKDSLTVLLNNATRLGGFIDDLLDVARIERGKMDVRPEPFDASRVIREVRELYKAQAEKKGIELWADLAGDLPPAFADPGRTNQILTNLVSNALKFTDKGKVVIKAAREEGQLVIGVADSGIGIPEAQLEKIFDKFEQVRDARRPTGAPKGTGLGLAIVRGLVEAQGGRIGVESKLGIGSTFTFTLPVKREA